MTIRRRYVDGPFGQIHLAETEATGDDPGPRCLLLHQTPRSWDEFREVMELLDGRIGLTAMDLPGMGASDAGQAPARIEHYADAAEAVIDDLTSVPASASTSNSTIAVCGHHTGGVVAVELAARRSGPDRNASGRVERLVLSSTPWVDADARRSRAERDPIDTVTRAADGAHLLTLWNGRAPHYPDHRLLDRFTADALRSTDPAIGHLAVGAYEMERRIDRIRCPVTVIEHGADPFASRHTDTLVEALGPNRVDRLTRIPNGRVALEATAPAFAEALVEALVEAMST